jgi:hypothetical protein
MAKLCEKIFGVKLRLQVRDVWKLCADTGKGVDTEYN